MTIILKHFRLISSKTLFQAIASTKNERWMFCTSTFSVRIGFILSIHYAFLCFNLLRTKRREKRLSLLNKIMSYIWSRFWQRHPFSTFWCHGDDDTAATTSLWLSKMHSLIKLYIYLFVRSLNFTSYHIFLCFFPRQKNSI